MQANSLLELSTMEKTMDFQVLILVSRQLQISTIFVNGTYILWQAVHMACTSAHPLSIYEQLSICKYFKPFYNKVFESAADTVLFPPKIYLCQYNCRLHILRFHTALSIPIGSGRYSDPNLPALPAAKNQHMEPELLNFQMYRFGVDHSAMISRGFGSGLPQRFCPFFLNSLSLTLPLTF